MESCWLCNQMFPNLTTLHRHLGSKVHNRLRVVCPWCLGQEKTFTRIADLKIHCGTHHPESMEQSSKFFSMGNGFYMARFPKDYKRIASISHWDSDEACEARRLMTRWCASQTKSEMISLHWKAGWVEALTTSGQIKRGHDMDLGPDPEIEIGEPEPSPQSPPTKVRKVIVKEKSKEKTDKAENTITKKRETKVKETAKDHKKENQNNGNRRDLENRIFGFTSDDEGEKETSSDCTQPAWPESESMSDSESQTEDSDSEDTTKEIKEKLKTREEVLRKEIQEIEVELNHQKSETRKGRTTSEEEVRKRAEMVLSTGAMPLCPPGRRDWGAVGVFSIEIGTRTHNWPPKDHQKMTPDERLLAWEFFAMLIEQEEQGKFPSISRQLLLDKYNFLALPGTQKRFQGRDRACRKLRFYNYQLLRGIATDGVASQEALGVLDCLEENQKNQKQTLATEIIRQIQNKVSLRLDKE